MPWLGLGVWRTPALETAQVVREASSVGYRAVDTAAFYGNEAGVGVAARHNPSLFITTKLWNNCQGYDQALRAFEASEKLIGQGRIDLYLIHWPCPGQDRYVETWRALIQLRREGRVRAIGVSNFLAPHLARLEAETGILPAVNQIEIHPRFQQRALVDYCLENGILPEAWRPLGGGEALGLPVVVDIAKATGRTPAQVVLRWLLQRGCAVIPKSVHKARMVENADIFNFTLSAAQMAAMAGLDSPAGRLGPDPATFGG
ncbi:aldo/keto reductase [Formicincola oecophyllae]|uniref:Aldo/keto reductase n=2 Tax=Formicincola oecophyllae TaxID=2558361 RepID=A0A4Y6UDJ4_9PROT|nr:aldo/keto reductase [Formicincola oecophyllae]